MPVLSDPSWAARQKGPGYFRPTDILSQSEMGLKRGEPLPARCCSLEAFRNVFDRERRRTERTGNHFSLVIFSGEELAGRAKIVNHFVRTLSRRLRSTDEIGIVAGDSLGVLMPDTPGQGARKVLTDIARLSPSEFLGVSFHVYTYPVDWVPGKSQPLDRLQAAALGMASGPLVSILDKSEALPRNPNDGSCPNPGISQFRRLSDIVGPFFPPAMPWWKRAFDITASLGALVLLSPIFLLIALLIKSVSRGPIFFTQKRIGHLGKHFTMYKFRTLFVDADSAIHENYYRKLMEDENPMLKLDICGDPRIIPCGKILRQTGLDELPQLVNVLRGEMSLVGHRPCLPYEVEKYRLWQTRRFDAVPGLTGLWQVNGKNRTTFKEMIRMDIEYAQQRSFWLDLKIILKTIPAIIGQLR